MASQEYLELLKDPRWQKLRLEVLSAANWTCVCCGATDLPFNVNHKVYRKGAKPWEYSLDELEALCERCHKLYHLAKKFLFWFASNASAQELICSMEWGHHGGGVNREIVSAWLERLEWWFSQER